MIVIAAALLVLLWVQRSGKPWSDIGYVRPRSWVQTVAIGIACGVAFKLVMKALVMPLLGADPINQHYRYLMGNTAALPGMLFTVVVGAGWAEETLWRGFAFDRLRRILGSKPWAKVVVVAVSALLFGLAHYPDQRLAGVQQGTIVGVVYGTVYSLTQRIWPLVIAHAAFDITAVALIYWNVETEVAQFIFR
ncbi:MAG TPA: CPBP family intramembrane glutamic endopeptidase [Gemmatimonadaceae bacterium]|nr:CPBP family intramembrane glutamic endopeptidase [Gemmatimonadaceae bacterium]